MPAKTTLAYVIKTQDYRDTSLLATFFTSEYGKIKAVIKGGRDARGRLGSSLEPFSLNEILVYKRRRGDLHLVTGAELIDRFDRIREDLYQLGTATYFMELIDQMVDADPHRELMQLIHEALNFLQAGHSPKRTSRIFEIRLMHALGFLPELNQCIRCQTKKMESFYFSVSSGGLVCHGCRHHEQALLIIPKGCVGFLERAYQSNFESLGKVKVSREVGEKLEQMMRQFLDFHLASVPKSLIFLEKLDKAEQRSFLEYGVEV